MNPEYIRLLLEPVMQYLATGRWKQPYMIHDVGAAYPSPSATTIKPPKPSPSKNAATS